LCPATKEIEIKILGIDRNAIEKNCIPGKNIYDEIHAYYDLITQ
jgi:hypothetical protein